MCIRDMLDALVYNYYYYYYYYYYKMLGCLSSKYDGDRMH